MPFKHLLVLGVKMLFLRLLNIYISALKQSFFLKILWLKYLNDISIFKNKTGKDIGYGTTITY